MGSIGIIFLDYSAKSKIFNLPKHIQLLRCGPLRERTSDGSADADPSPSDPLVGDLSPIGKVTDQEFDARVSPLMLRRSRGWTRTVRLR